MTEVDVACGAGKLRARRVGIALCFANGVVLNEIAFMFGGSGVRVPLPVFEHYATLVLLSLPAILVFAIQPGRPLTVFRVVTTGLRAACIALLNGLVGVAVLLLVFGVATGIAARSPGPFLVGALLVTCLIGALWMRMLSWRHLLYLAWVPPAFVAGARIGYVPPVITARLDDGCYAYVVEAGMQCLPSDPDFRVCSAQTILPGILEWWHRVGRLPSNSRDVSLRVDGADLVVEYEARDFESGSPPIELRITVR